MYKWSFPYMQDIFNGEDIIRTMMFARPPFMLVTSICNIMVRKSCPHSSSIACLCVAISVVR